MVRFVLFLIIALIAIALIGAPAVIMALVSAMTIMLFKMRQETMVWDQDRTILLGVLILGLIMISILRVILLHGAR